MQGYLFEAMIISSKTNQNKLLISILNQSNIKE